MDSESKALPFQSSSMDEPSVCQARSLDTAEADRTVPEYTEADHQRHRNIYVAVHMPHTHSRHKHRHKRKHAHKHGNNRSHHTNGHDHHGDNTSDYGNGQDYHDNSEVGGDSSFLNVSADAEHIKVSDHKGVARSRSLDMDGQTRYSRFNSLPTGYLTSEVTTQPPAPLDPITPSDPCDRVKFILGGEHDDQPDNDCDNTAHNIFTELEELKYNEHDHRMQWKETARWIKFEEDVEEGGDKWSKPHVATLSLHSLFELRSCIFKGTVLLDLQADNLATISDVVLDNLVSTGQLLEQCRERVKAALLQRHLHQNSKKEHSSEKKLLEHIKSLGELGRHGSDNLMLGHNGSILGSRNSSRRGSILGEGGTKNGSVNGVRLEEENPDVELRKPDSFMKKLPPGSEASNVLVGEVDFLTAPIIAFVRLARGQYLGDLTEVPIPTRFIFIMLGPKGHQERYHEIGRSISTLMSDEVFHEVAYKARNRGDLLAGIDEFLDKVTVLPPGEWDPQIRLEPPSKVPSQAKRKNMVDSTKQSEIVSTEPHKCKHCNIMMDHSKTPMKWTKKPFQGLIRDLTRCYSVYRGDFSSAFSIQSVAALIVIYFANITLAFAFGALLSDQTAGALGATETILAVGISNFIYSIFSGQPLVNLGPTGPTFIFERIISDFCRMQGIPFLEFRFWIGMWTLIFMIVLVGLNTSAITRLFTRFTQEVFTVMIGLVFIYEAFRALWNIHLENPYNQWVLYPTIKRKCDCYEFPNLESAEAKDITNATLVGSFWSDPKPNCSKVLLRDYITHYPGHLGCEGMDYSDIFFMSVILFFGTFIFCIYFKKIRNMKFLRSYIRSMMSDFAVFIAVMVWVVVDVLAKVSTPKLVVPNVFNSESGVYTQANRSFIIHPLGNDLPLWAPGAAILPALLATILLFMDQHITAIIVNRKDNKLKKQPGYHLDIFIIGWLIFLHSLLGLPWVVGATILSITHVNSLHQYSSSTAPGERPKFIGIREQRVTLFLMAILVGLSVMASEALKLLPLPVLYGLVLYLGVSSLYGVQFIQRFKLFFIRNKHKPDYEYLRHVPNRRIHLYTAIQIIFLLFLCVFQAHFYLQVFFPIMVLSLVIGRWLIGFGFSKHDIELLDDPIPDSLYCTRCRKKNQSKMPLDMEKNESLDTVESSARSSIHDISVTASYDHVSTDVLISKQEFVDQHQEEESFNLTHEVDKCDLWKNMVKNLDAPPCSLRTKTSSTNHETAGTDFQQHPLDNDRKLFTLEECDTDLEMQTPLENSEGMKSMYDGAWLHQPQEGMQDTTTHKQYSAGAVKVSRPGIRFQSTAV